MADDPRIKQGLIPLPALVVVFLLLALFAFRWYEISKTAQTYIFNDVWRHSSTQLMPLLSGEGSIRLLWANIHANPSLALHQLFSFKFLNFDTRTDYFLMLFLNIALTALLLRFFLKQAQTHGQNLSRLILISIAICVGLLGARHNSQLVTLQTYPLFLGTLLAILTDQILARDNRRTRDVLSLTLLSLLVLFSHFGYGSIFCVALFLTSLIFVIFNRDRSKIWVPITLIASLIAYTVFLGMIRSELNSVAEDLTPRWIVLIDAQTWYDLLTAFPARILSAITLDLKPVPELFQTIEQPLLLWIQTIVFSGLLVWVLFRILKQKIPGGILAINMFVVGVVFTFFLPMSFRGDTIALQDLVFVVRYEPIYRYSACGLILMIILVASTSTGRLASKRIAITNMLCWLTGVFFLAGWIGKEIQHQKRFDNKAFANSQFELALYMAAFEENVIDLKANKLSPNTTYKWVIPFMFEHKVNIYSDAFEGHSEIEAYKRARKKLDEIGKENFDIKILELNGKKKSRQLCTKVTTEFNTHQMLQVSQSNNGEIIRKAVKISKDEDQIFTANFYQATQNFYVPLDPGQSYKICILKKALDITQLKLLSHSLANLGRTVPADH